MNILVHEEPGKIHLPNSYAATTHHTLCGWCDVPHEDTDAEVNCNACMAVLEHVLRLAKDREVIKSMPRASTIERARRALPEDADALERGGA